MKCPDCGAWTSVLETRTRSTGVVVRRYVCANEHRFTTEEVVLVVDPMALPRGRPMRELGVTEARARQIRKELL